LKSVSWTVRGSAENQSLVPCHPIRSSDGSSGISARDHKQPLRRSRISNPFSLVTFTPFSRFSVSAADGPGNFLVVESGSSRSPSEVSRVVILFRGDAPRKRKRENSGFGVLGGQV